MEDLFQLRSDWSEEHEEEVARLVRRELMQDTLKLMEEIGGWPGTADGLGFWERPSPLQAPFSGHDHCSCGGSRSSKSITVIPTSILGPCWFRVFFLNHTRAHTHDPLDSTRRAVLLPLTLLPHSHTPRSFDMETRALIAGGVLEAPKQRHGQ